MYIFDVFQMDKFEIDSCRKWIEDNHFNIIALQVPDEDLDKVQDLIDSLTSSIQNENIEFFLVGDGCSSCCNDLLNAQYCQAQGLIHFGHSCLGSSEDENNQQTISIFYVFYQQSLPYVSEEFVFTIHILFLLGMKYQTFCQLLQIMINLIVLFSMIHVFVMLLNSIQHHLLVLYSRKLV
jgi:diphthamide biosynthesis enzyme Dph1/Dph2-like protein